MSLAVRAELDGSPATDSLTDTDLYAMIDYRVIVGAVLTERKPVGWGAYTKRTGWR